MTRQYILKAAFVLLAGCTTMGFSQSDTLVLNQAEFRFPETHPGEVFLVKKVVLSAKGSLSKSAAIQPSSSQASPAPSAQPSPLASRDLRGRSAQGGGEYQKRMERVRRAHGLPTAQLAAEDAGRPFQIPETFVMPEDGRFAVVSTSPKIRNAEDLEAMEVAERRAVRRKYGALSKTFTERVNAMKDGEEMDITLELAINHPGYINGMKATEEEKKANAQAWLRAKPLVRGEDLLRQYGLAKPKVAESGPQSSRMVDARANRAQIQQLAQAFGVVSVSEKIIPGMAAVPGSGSPNFEVLVNSAYNPASAMQNYGDVDVATIEIGLRPGFVDSIPTDVQPASYNPYLGACGTGPNICSAHSEATYYLLAKGSPGSYRRHFESGTFGGVFDSIVQYNIRSLSTSWAGVQYSEIAPDSRFIDHMNFVWPYPVFSLAAGNTGINNVPVNRSYNSLVAGNVQHYDNSHYRVDCQFVYGGINYPRFLDNVTMTRNPDAKYGSVRDWELPSLVAPGCSPDPWFPMYHPQIFFQPGGLWPSGGGTSFSAPVTAALVANALSARGLSYNWPSRATEARAMMLVTAENVDSGYWNPGVQDSRDGAGTVSGANAVKFAQEAFLVTPGDQGYPSGMASNYLDSIAFKDPQPIRYNIDAPATLPTGKHLRIVLTWTSSPGGVTTAENEVSDMGLSVTTKTGPLSWQRKTRSSNTWNSNVEIIDVPNSDIFLAQTIPAYVHKSIWRRPADGPSEIYYTIAWTWVKDHAD